MLFNSFEFAIFLPLVFLLYWFVFHKSVRVQNIFLLVAGYVFYGWWDWRFLFLIAFSTTLDYTVGRWLGSEQNARRRKLIFMLSIIINLGFLGFFKYYNFFVDNFILAFSRLGYHLHAGTLKVVLPVGISFYTFQSLSYTIDVYKRKMEPTRDFISFAAFISFFPQLVAGPIERAFHLLPQFYAERRFDFQLAVAGMRQILWGLFKKVVIADTLATYVDQIFGNYAHLPGSTLVLGAVYFAVQIYCDFSGYSSIAIGTARLFGFSLMTNFSYPYFCTSVASFWRHWHISLTSWFRDYVYIPLGGSRGSLFRTTVNTLLVFTLSGFWHGANWTFIIWGLLNGLFILPHVFRTHLLKQRPAESTSPLIRFVQMAFTFGLVTFTWIFFRSSSSQQAFEYIHGIFSRSLFTYPVQHGMAMTLPLIAVLFVVEWMRYRQVSWVQPPRLHPVLRWSVYLIMIITCLAFYKQNQAFIYFQF
ncbi:MAG: MBOAT family protein [Bacteroidetes bacterium]|nr:MBOAT family protein [Bacteroidota bacterium]